ncbi:MAG: recombination mediator RecR [Cyclobacteriaceae bacterium]|nr:recombination mediator RecR [Cyclobacteriaceae bacterium]
MQYPSKHIEKAVEEISKLPGIGKKTALRLALHLLKEKEGTSHLLANSLIDLRTKTKYCIKCHNISDDDICGICASHRRDKSIICVVEDTRDVLAIENTGQYSGLYHVLNGVISPMDGIGPSELTVESLLERIKTNEEVKEIIFALSPTMEGDTTSFYLTKKMKNLPLELSTIARGVPIGGELEYTDEITLGRSIITRTKNE